MAEKELGAWTVAGRLLPRAQAFPGVGRRTDDQQLAGCSAALLLVRGPACGLRRDGCRNRGFLVKRRASNDADHGLNERAEGHKCRELV
jgi:hypothetical protein